MTQIHLVFPAHPLRSSAPDPMFDDQVAALRSAGFSTSTVPDAVIDGTAALRGLPHESRLIAYRGWMLDAAKYERLAAAVEAAGCRMLSDPRTYLSCHHLPNWYPLVADLTPETRVLDGRRDYAEQLRELGWGAYFVKDFVKSLKTSIGSIVRVPDDIQNVLTEMRRVRGDIEGGVVVRRVEDFDPDSERRYFVLDGVAHDPDGREPPPLVADVASRIVSRFFSADVARLRDGTPRLVEIGDGQVSDLVGWTPGAFAQIWKRSDGGTERR